MGKGDGMVILSRPTRRGLLGATVTAPLAQFAANRPLNAVTPRIHGGDMPTRDLASHDTKSPIIVFDVNETLLDLNVLAPVFTRVFGDATMVRVWFDKVVLYSEALSLADDYADFGTIAVAVLEMLARAKGRTVEAVDLAELKRLSAAMPTYNETPKALAALKSAGFRLVTLSNNPTAGVDIQLTHAKIRAFFDELHSIDDHVYRYKPAREATPSSPPSSASLPPTSG